MWRWIESKKTGWNEFYNFLESSARIAKEILINESINAALSTDSKKQKCSSCNKLHSGKCSKTKTTAAIQGTGKTCLSCNKEAHKFKAKSGAEGITKRIKDCPFFQAATEDQKQEIVKRIKTKGPICSKCSSWSHKSEDCRWNKSCSKCNEVHIFEMCDIKKYFSCSMSARSNSCLMSLQDIPLHNSRSLAQVMFDNGSEVMLVSSIFAKKNRLPYEEASYTLAGIGSSPTTYNNGRIYSIPLLDSNKEIT